MTTEAVDQLAMDEEVIHDKEAEAALEQRETRKAQLGAVRKEYKEADEEARFAIARHDIPEDGAVRFGRFRVSRRSVPARTVAFETEPTTRLTISVDDD